MLRIITLIVVIVAFCVGASVNANANDLDNLDFKSWDEWVATYYIHHDVSYVPAFLSFVNVNTKCQSDYVAIASGALPKLQDKTTPCSAAMTLGSLAALFSQNPDKIKGWLREDFQDNFKENIAFALVASDMGESAPQSYMPFIKKAQDNYDNVKLKDLSIKRPCDIKALWGAFFVTGDVVYVNRVIDALDKTKSPSGNINIDLLVRNDAKWSLIENQNDKRVHQAMVDRLNEQNKNLNAALEDILARGAK